MDPQLKGRTKELGDAINKSLSDSKEISEAVSRIKEDGYQIDGYVLDSGRPNI